MDTELAQSLGEIQRSLGRIEGNLSSHLVAFNEHVASDALTAANVKSLELAYANQRGFSKALTLVYTGAAAAVGAAGDWLANYFLKQH